jgi:hypothetical protein
MSAMTRAERVDLQRLVRQREKVLKSAAKQRSAELIADFENQMGSEYSFDQDETWAEAQKVAEREVKKAQALIAARAASLVSLIVSRRTSRCVGTAEAMTTLSTSGRSNCAAWRRQFSAVEQKAIVKIETSCLDAQTKLALAGCTSDMATGFVKSLPAVESLTPRLSYDEIAGEAEPPVAEQLISLNALRTVIARGRYVTRE